MYLSQLSAPLGRCPRPYVTVNGIQLPAYDIEVTNTAHFSSDTFRLELSVEAAMAVNPSLTPAFWASTVSLNVVIGIGNVTNGTTAAPTTFTQLISGTVDEIEYDFSHQCVVLSGRDYASRFIDNKVNLDNSFVNLTSSQVAAQLAAKRNLTTTGITATTTPVGNYYSGNASLQIQDRTEWDLLVFLAQQEGFIVSVIGSGLYFGPAATGTPYVVTFQPPTATNAIVANVKGMRGTHNLTLAQGVSVTVQTYNYQDGTTHSKTSTATPNGVTIPSGVTPTDYVITIPSGTAAQVAKSVSNRVSQIMANEKVLSISVPGDETLTILQPIQVQGTGTAWDMTYPIDSITRRLSFSGGFEMDIRAKAGSAFTVT